MTNKMDEMIIVAPRDAVFENEQLTFQGVNSNLETLKQIMNNVEKSYSIMCRGDAEENEAFKQPIPYCVLKSGDKVFAYERLTGGGETRLHNQVSLGLGGHMNAIEADTFNEVLFENMSRELEEEVYISSDLKLETVGLINDDLNNVGKVHLGLLVIGHLAEDATVEVREVDQLKGMWINISDLKNEEVYNSLESWSKFVADILNK